MTAPSFLNTGFAFTQLAAATDVQNIIDAVTTMLGTTLSSTPTGVYPSGERWAVSGSGPVVYTAPSDNGGRFMKVTLTRTAQARLEFKFEDPGGVIADGEIDINTPGTLVNIFGGPGHLCIEANNNGTWEVAAAIMTDPTPEPLASTNVYVFGRTSRNTAGTLLANNGNGAWWLQRFRGGTVSGTTYYENLASPTMPAQVTTNTHMRTQAGSDVASPAYMGCDSANGGVLWLNAGKLYQSILLDGNDTSGSIISVPIDTGITGQFLILHLGPFRSSQFAMRKA